MSGPLRPSVQALVSCPADCKTMVTISTRSLSSLMTSTFATWTPFDTLEIRISSAKRDREPEMAAPLFSRFGAYRSSHQGDGTSRDRQAQACSGLFRAAAFVGFEDLFQLGGGDPGAIVSHMNHGLIASTFERDLDPSIVGEFDGVIRQVLNCRCHQLRIGPYDDLAIKRRLELQALATGLSSRRGQRLFDDIGRAQVVEHRLGLAGLELARQERLFDEILGATEPVIEKIEHPQRPGAEPRIFPQLRGGQA